MAASVQVEIVRDVTPEVVHAFEGLVPQLSSSAPSPSRAMLEAIVTNETSTLFVARAVGGALVGTATLTVFLIPTGLRAWIDDVVVAADARGRGVGEALVRAALDRAAELGVPAVHLTSRPEREAANRLYRRMGFRQRETNAYVFTF